MKKTILLFISLIALILGSYAQDRVEARLDSVKIMLGDQVGFNVSVFANDDAKITFPVYKNTQEIASGVEVVETKDDTLNTSDGIKQYIRTYFLTSWNEGSYEVPSLSVKVNGKIFRTNSIPFKVETLKLDTLQQEQIQPEKDVMDNPFQWSEWLPLVGWLLLVVLCITGIIYLYRRMKDNNPIFPNIRFVKKVLPHEKAMSEIEQIKKEQLTRSEDQKTYYTRLTDTLRTYLEARYGFNAKEMTSEEIIDELRKDDSQTKIKELRQLFETADLVKFAKYSVLDDENDMYLSDVVRFIDETKLEEEVVEKVGEELTEEEKRNNRSLRMSKLLIIILSIIVVIILAYMGWQVYQLLL